MKIYKGKVISIKAAKTVTVAVEMFLSHKVYKKRFKRNKKYQVNTDREMVVGEMIKFVETRPISKTKKWKVLESKL